MQVTGDLAGRRIGLRLVAEGRARRSRASRAEAAADARSAGSGSWLPAIQIQSRPRCSARSAARSIVANARGAIAVVEAVAERDDEPRRVSGRSTASGAPAWPRCRRAAAARRARRSSSPFPGAGRRRRAGLRPASTARPAGSASECGAGKRDLRRARNHRAVSSPGPLPMRLTASPPSPVPPPLPPAARRTPRHRPTRGRSPASPAPPAARRGRAPYGRFGP